MGVHVVRDWGRAVGDMAAAGWSALRRRAAALTGDGGCEPIPVVVLPGILEPWRYLLPLGNWLAEQGHPVHYVRGLGFNLGDLASSAAHVADLVVAEDLDGGVFFAHSKGGLIGKQALLDAAVASRIEGMVALSTPFAGASLGQRFHRAITRTRLGMFTADSPVLRALHGQEEINARIVSLTPQWDQVVSPAATRLPGGNNVDLHTSGHFTPLRQRAVWEEIHHHIHGLTGRAI